MKITILNPHREQVCYARVSLDEVYYQLKDGALRPDPTLPSNKRLCFAA